MYTFPLRNTTPAAAPAAAPVALADFSSSRVGGGDRRLYPQLLRG